MPKRVLPPVALNQHVNRQVARITATAAGDHQVPPRQFREAQLHKFAAALLPADVAAHPASMAI
jgi:hypothetical protein